MALMERKDREVFDCLDLSKEFKLTKIENSVEVPDEENRIINNKAYSELLMSMDVSTPEGEHAFNTLKAAKQKGAREGFKRLVKRYEPHTTLDRGKLLQNFFSSKCKDHEDPEQFAYRMDNLRTTIHELMGGKTVIDDEAFMHQVLNSLPRSYETMVEKLQGQIDLDGAEKLTIVKMIEELGMKSAKLKHFKKSPQGPEELALVGYNKFKGRCHFCGKIGHKASNCRDKQSKSQGSKKPSSSSTFKKKESFVPKCYNCGEIGHKKPDYPKLKKKEGACLCSCR